MTALRVCLVLVYLSAFFGCFAGMMARRETGRAWNAADDLSLGWALVLVVLLFAGVWR